MLFVKIIGWRMLNLERKIFRSANITSTDFDGLSVLFLRVCVILRDRELIGSISHLVQFFHV